MPFEQLKILENAYGVLYASFVPNAKYQLSIIPQQHVKVLTNFTLENFDA